MTRRSWLLTHLGLSVAAFVSGAVFALGGCHPSWMVTTFVFTLAAVIAFALFFSSP